ncbi:MAG: hypothetical protein ACXV5I_06750 [Halobacteriota archaeon]
MKHELELEPMNGYYRLIKNASSGAQERALHNVPTGDICVAALQEQTKENPPSKSAPEGRHGQALLSAIGQQSDLVIGSKGQRRMRF